jgi:hypothetical protein
MQVFSLTDLELPPWHVWAVPLTGVVTAWLTLFAGWAFLRRRRLGPPTVAPKDAGPDPFEHGSRTEKRTTLRRQGNPIEVLVNDAEATGEPVRAWVIDRSMGGLGLAVSEAVDVGTVLSLRPCQAPLGTPWVRVEVKTCKRARDQFEVGCQFVRTPPWSILLLFG